MVGRQRRTNNGITMTESLFNKSLTGQTALVTGSSSGIGRAIAIALANSGADVHLHARSNKRGIGEVRSIVRELGSGGNDLMVDLADADTYCKLVDDVWRHGPVDIWVNNAGADVLTGDAANWPFERKLTALWTVDVRATMMLSRLVGMRMKERATGTIINLGWDQATVGMEGDSGEMFAAAKGAVMAFTRSLARTLAPEVRVNCVAPGWIRTKWSDSASDYWDRRARYEALVGRWGTSEDVAAAVLFLASPAAEFITGTVLPVNGGFAGPYRSAE